tara:strand:+ start:558 stop:1607 length:1050 start_codon:yes stop_codon:yes gene_type:complete
MPLFTGSKFGFGKDAAGDAGPAPGQPFSASGGDVTPAGITPGNGYTYHVFTSSGTFTLTGNPADIEVLLVAGGGGGGNPLSAGGGAGGVVHAILSFDPGPHAITIGDGGFGAPQTCPSPGPAGAKGGDSTMAGHPLGTITAEGGGGGGPYDGTVPAPSLADMSGGSGGGARTYSPPYQYGVGNQPTLNPAFTPNPTFNQYGNPGGRSPNYPGPSPTMITDPQGNAGGGAGAAGNTVEYEGGAGQPFPGFASPLISPQIPGPVQPSWIPEVGASGYYGGGGGAGCRDSSSGSRTGGAGGGADGNSSGGGNAATNYTGGGGSAGSYSTGGGGGEPNKGGVGICVIRYIAIP